jgi:EAL domain-containing protein (putative c-di-GMP-specific phosphodiesterase class I)
MDRRVREGAIAFFAKNDSSELLFLNVRPAWMIDAWRRNKTLRTIEMLKSNDFDPSRVVIEITEDSFQGSIDELAEIVERYRECGCRIAVDDVGSGFSYLDRIAVLHPDIIKLDIRILKRSGVHDGYRTLVTGFSLFAAQSGASLVVEGVENEDELVFCFDVGARYVQGFLFSGAEAELQPDAEYDDLVSRVIAARRRRKTEVYRASVMSARQGTRAFSGRRWSQRRFRGARNHPEQLLADVARRVDPSCVRMYICDWEGNQLSTNWLRHDDGTWRCDASYRGSNWSWRPYFIPNAVIMEVDRRGVISVPYRDLETKHLVQTYSCPIGGAALLFLDFLLPEDWEG